MTTQIQQAKHLRWTVGRKLALYSVVSIAFAVVMTFVSFDGDHGKSFAILAVGVVVMAVTAGIISRTVTQPLGQSVKSLDALANKDLTQSLDVKTSDETADMARAFNAASASLKAALERIAQSSETLESASGALMGVSAELSQSAGATSTQSSALSQAGTDVRVQVETVAAAVEEMTASISEIATSASEAAIVAGRAVEIAARTNTLVVRLGESSTEIDDVVRLISSIAEQTNLLALNATIEAARAGEAGKGFAVVADEVKDLANDTSKATDEIANRIRGIQAQTKEAVESISEISDIIGQISSLQTTIASAVEEQAATTSEIGRGIHEAARGAEDIAGSVSTVADAAQTTALGVDSTQRTADELAQTASQLRELVGEFRY
jgi:methyl-accepting chemotaxis protein